MKEKQCLWFDAEISTRIENKIRRLHDVYIKNQINREYQLN